MAESKTNELTVIGRDTRIKGEMEFESGARILGRFEGRIRAAGEVQVGEGATCEAAVEAERIVVDGAVKGDLMARDRLTLSANAEVHGDIAAGTLVVVEGATFVGHCSVGPEAGKAASPAEKQSVIAEPKAEPRVEPKAEIKTKPVSAGDLTPPWKKPVDLINDTEDASSETSAA